MKKYYPELAVILVFVLSFWLFVIVKEIQKNQDTITLQQENWQCLEWKNVTVFTGEILTEIPKIVCGAGLKDFEYFLNNSTLPDCVIVSSLCELDNEIIFCQPELKVKQTCIKEGINCKEKIIFDDTLFRECLERFSDNMVTCNADDLIIQRKETVCKEERVI